MLVIGIDPGTARMGYGLVRLTDTGKLELVTHGVVVTEANTPMPERLQTLRDSLNEILELHQPESGAVEKLFFQRNVSSAISVGQARGVVLLTMADVRVEVDEYTPHEIKQAVVGYGGAGKRQVQEMVRTLLGMEEIPRPDDAADALAVAICHAHSRQSRQRMEELS
jgi:crossover junction endodeoxyribonuclease RuvC